MTDKLVTVDLKEKEMSDEEWNDWFAWSERKRYEDWLEQPIGSRKKEKKMREVRIYAWMLFVLFCFCIGFKTLLEAVLSSGWAWTIATGMTLFSLYFFEEVYQKR